MDFYTNVCRTRDKILVKGYKNGKQQKLTVSYRPNHYIPSKKGDTPFKSLDGRSLEAVNLNSMGGARKFREQYNGVDGFEIHGYDRYIYTYIADKFQGDIEFDLKHIKIATLDIECECEDGFPEPTLATEKVNAISLKPLGKDTHVFGLGPWEHNRTDVVYHNCNSEVDLLTQFIKYWRQESFDIITGWNVNSFDITYLCNRIDRILGEGEHKKLSPWNQCDVREFMSNYGQRQMIFNLYGVNVLDYLELYRKHTFVNQESYKLENIAQVELGTGKLDYSEYGNLHTLYKQDYAKFLEYNVKDVVLVEQLEEKLGLIELTCAMSYNAKCNYNDTFGMVKYWETIIYNFLKEQNIQTPPQRLKSGNDKTHQIIGAYVKDPIVGGHDWVVSFDLNSLYPHIIMQYNISPEKMIKGNRQDLTIDRMLNKECDLSYVYQQGHAVCPNGVMYSKNKQGFLPELMEKFYDERKEWKKKMIGYQKEREVCKEPKRKKELDTLIKRAYNNQQVRKIALNSAYGALANQYFAFFSIDLAESITTSGQLIIKWAEKTINEFLNKTLNTEGEDYVIAMDTDSVYITMDKLVKQVLPEETDKTKIVDFLNKSEGMIEQVLARGFDDLAEYTNAFQQKMQMGREVIADRGIWTAKKRYILNVHDNEGVRLAEPKLKMMGIETAKSSTPQWVRTKLTEALKVVMNGTEQDLWEFVETARKEFRNLPPEEVAFPRGVKNLVTYSDPAHIYGKGTPIHVRGSLLHNHLLKSKNLNMRYEMIKNSDKIRFAYLTTPNPINENVIAFSSSLPRELDLHRFIDYDMQFDKAFNEPLKNIVNLINWNVEPVASLDSFFG
jgi:DNA polymerase elongation subunit (family B)